MLLLVWGTLAPAQGGREPKEEEPEQSEEWRAKWTTDPDLADPRWQQAVKFRRYGDVDAAIALYEEFLAEDAKEVTVLVSMGVAHWEKGALKEAETWLRRAKELVPKHIKARQFLGQLLLHQGRFTEAKAEFEGLVALDWNRPDVKASGHLNLGRIALIERRFPEADKYFYETGRSPDNGDRHSAMKGRRLVLGYRSTRLWPSEKGERLHIYFSPTAGEASDPAKRRAFAAEREKLFARMCTTLGVSFPEPWVVYCFAEEVDGYAVNGSEAIHDWKYSWWIIHDAWKEPAGHQIAHQLVARVGGGRPANKILVEGLCCYLDGDSTDPHAAARALLAQKKLKSLARMQVDQSYSLETARPYASSWVAWLIDTYGMERFLLSYRWFNNVFLARFEIEDPVLRAEAALSEVYRRGVGEDLPSLERAWREFLSR
jgi:tetratricopeptide (TPR) repeat protein